MKAQRSRVELVVEEPDGTFARFESEGDAHLGGHLLRVLSRSFAAYRPELEQHAEGVNAFMELGASLGAIFRKAFTWKPPIEQEVDNAKDLGSFLPAYSGERVTINPDGTAEVVVTINGHTVTYTETDVHLPASAAGDLEEIADYRLGFRQNLIDLLAVHGWSKKTNIPDHELADLFMADLQRMDCHLATIRTDDGDQTTIVEPFNADAESEAHAARIRANIKPDFMELNNGKDL